MKKIKEIEKIFFILFLYLFVSDILALFAVDIISIQRQHIGKIYRQLEMLITILTGLIVFLVLMEKTKFINKVEKIIIEVILALSILQVILVQIKADINLGLLIETTNFGVVGILIFTSYLMFKNYINRIGNYEE